MKIYQQVRSKERSKFAKFLDNTISFDGVMTSQIVWNDVKIWWHHISVKNVDITLKLCRLFEPVVAIICINFASIHKVERDLRHWRLPTAYYKGHGLKNYLMLNEKG